MTERLPDPLAPPRTLAATKGRARYVDGNPCVHGHVGERYTRNASCVECQRESNRRDKERIQALMDGARR